MGVEQDEETRKRGRAGQRDRVRGRRETGRKGEREGDEGGRKSDGEGKRVN